MRKFERKLTFCGLPTLIQDLLIRLRLVHVSCSGAMEEPGYDFPILSLYLHAQFYIHHSSIPLPNLSLIQSLIHPLLGAELPGWATEPRRYVTALRVSLSRLIRPY